MFGRVNVGSFSVGEGCGLIYSRCVIVDSTRRGKGTFIECSLVA